MKKKLLTLSAILALTTGMAQAQKKISFGARGGVNFTNMTGKDGAGEKLDNKMKPGFHLGFNAELSLADQFYLQPGLLFTTKGSKFEKNEVSAKTSIAYMEIPINFLYKPELGSGKLLLGAGPYVAFGVGGKSKTNETSVSVKFKNKITPEDGAAFYLKGMDAGANFLVGYELSSKISAQLNAQLGLTNISPKTEGDNTSNTKNSGFGISLGYRF
ncbi:MAG: PorT family protein [Chitinophagaceae bacterium]|nr:PorT family protein [Chitinophagaceae bacterium]